MPLPKPRADESRDDFINRCMADETMNREFPDQEQRGAVCNTQWRQKDSEGTYQEDTMQINYHIFKITQEE